MIYIFFLHFEVENENFIVKVNLNTIKAQIKKGQKIMDNEQKAFQLILHSGNARSLAHEALELIKEDKTDEAKAKLNEAKTELVEAQKLHAQMLRAMANHEEVKVDLLLLHAEDHVCGSQSCLDMAIEVIAIYERFGQ